MTSEKPNAAYLDCFSGISGDMLLGSLKQAFRHLTTIVKILADDAGTSS